ncbi:hypothetical protein [Arhodomonas sp. AD133]|uniref:hypothetical protein n=1 Tax=Arhodomonas sp. AD133 TaxID=3415009 RepID=UPI003EC12BF6
MTGAQGRQFIRDCLPHGPGMCLLEAVLAWSDAHVVCRAREGGDNPLATEGGRLRAVHAVEYAAQATAVHGVLCGGDAARPGVIASVRSLRWVRSRLAGGAREVRCNRVLGQANAVVYDFELQDAAGPAVSGRVAVAFPEEA